MAVCAAWGQEPSTPCLWRVPRETAHPMEATPLEQRTEHQVETQEVAPTSGHSGSVIRPRRGLSTDGPDLETQESVCSLV